jgi:hypothetical protein
MAIVQLPLHLFRVDNLKEISKMNVKHMNVLIIKQDHEIVPSMGTLTMLGVDIPVLAVHLDGYYIVLWIIRH